jgi:hypothetical protein
MKLADALVIVNSELPRPVAYHQILAAIYQGVIPVARNESGTRWNIDATDIPEIREYFRGTMTKTQVPAAQPQEAA